MRILGIAPGSRFTGFGCIEAQGSRFHHVAHGTLRLEGPSKTTPLEFRLLSLHQKLGEIFKTYRPDVMALEKVFLAKNAMSALKLGQARGVAFLNGALFGVPVIEYSATEVKLCVSGYGRGSKLQIQKMVRLHLGNAKLEFDRDDAADALALAICHAKAGGPRIKRGRSISESVQGALKHKSMER